MNVLQFAGRYIGQQVQAPGGIGGECVDLANVYCLALGLPHEYRNAADWAGIALFGFAWTPNGPTNYPSPGDIVVWHADNAEGIGVNGHIALCLTADGMEMITLDQNWIARIVTLQLHSYGGISGWLHRA